MNLPRPDIALCDLLTKRAHLPLRRLLGASADSIAAYASGGYYRPGDPCDNVAAELERYQELGFTDFKLKFESSCRSTRVSSSFELGDRETSITSSNKRRTTMYASDQQHARPPENGDG